MHLLAGSAAALLIVLFALLLDRVGNSVTLDLQNFSLYPWDGSRMLLVAGTLALHTALLWAAALTLAAAPTAWRLPRRIGRDNVLLLALWILPAVLAAVLTAVLRWPISVTGLLLSASACAVAALAGRRLAPWYRHATVATRIFTLFLAFLVPALLLDPMINFFARRATEELITTRFAVEAQEHPQAIQKQMADARAEIDDLTLLPDLVRDAKPPATADAAFLVWSETVLAHARLTSSVELYNRTGELVSRFALNLPEYTGAAQNPQPATACDWDAFGEGARFGSEERSLLHAERNICIYNANGVPARLPARSSCTSRSTIARCRSSRRRPYFEVFRTSDEFVAGEATPGADVDVAIYGWGRRPIYTSARSAWPITDDLFTRIYKSREPFWATIRRDDETWRVHFSNDRWRIFAIGYPDADAVRSPRAPRRADHARRLRVRPRAAGHRPLHARQPRAAAGRPRAAARDSRQLLPQAVPRLRARVDHSGGHARAGHPRLLRGAAERRRARRGLGDGGRRAARDRKL